MKCLENNLSHCINIKIFQFTKKKTLPNIRRCSNNYMTLNQNTHAINQNARTCRPVSPKHMQYSVIHRTINSHTYTGYVRLYYTI
jgi:hypothetical protein